jgi:hypothetical protein
MKTVKLDVRVKLFLEFLDDRGAQHRFHPVKGYGNRHAQQKERQENRGRSPLEPSALAPASHPSPRHCFNLARVYFRRLTPHRNRPVFSL